MASSVDKSIERENARFKEKNGMRESGRSIKQLPELLSKRAQKKRKKKGKKNK